MIGIWIPIHISGVVVAIGSIIWGSLRRNVVLRDRNRRECVKGS